MAILSNTCKYAIRATIYLAVNEKENEKVGIKRIAEDLDIPTPFLGKILQNLVKYKILSSTKGPHGGFALAKNPADITLLDIIDVIDGMDLFSECLIGMRSCKEYEDEMVPCSIHSKFLPIRNQLYELFKNETIEDLRKEMQTSEGRIGI